MSKTLNLFIIFILSFCFILLSKAKELEISIPILEDTSLHHRFFFDLLDKALKQDNQSFRLIPKKLPQVRIKHYLAVGKISIYWMLESSKRNKKFEPIHVNLTNGLIGKRVLLIRPGDQYRFNNVKNLNEFRKLGLIGGFGKSWFDVNVWEANNLLQHSIAGNYKRLFQMLNLKKIDYFSRGINEIFGDIKEHPYLEIEKNLVLIYKRGFKFYLSKNGPNAGYMYNKPIKKALLKAQKSGLIDELIQKHWGNNLNKLNYEKRIKIHLKTPK